MIQPRSEIVKWIVAVVVGLVIVGLGDESRPELAVNSKRVGLGYDVSALRQIAVFFE